MTLLGTLIHSSVYTFQRLSISLLPSHDVWNSELLVVTPPREPKNFERTCTV